MQNLLESSESSQKLVALSGIESVDSSGRFQIANSQTLIERFLVQYQWFSTYGDLRWCGNFSLLLGSIVNGRYIMHIPQTTKLAEIILRERSFNMHRKGKWSCKFGEVDVLILT